MALVKGEPLGLQIDKQTLGAMRAFSDRRHRPLDEWYAYENADLGHPQVGHVRFLRAGPGCTLRTPPERHPDTDTEILWRYVRVGVVDLSAGVILAISEEPDA